MKVKLNPEEEAWLRVVANVESGGPMRAMVGCAHPPHLALVDAGLVSEDVSGPFAIARCSTTDAGKQWLAENAK